MALFAAFSEGEGTEFMTEAESMTEADM
jgi:hypothetical protein